MAKKDKGVLAGDPVTYQIPDPAGGVKLETFIPWSLVKRGVKREVITPLNKPEQFQKAAAAEQRKHKAEQDTPLMRALGLAHYWQQLLDSGRFQTITEIANAEGMDLGQVSRISRLTQLAPDIVEACKNYEQNSLVLEKLARRGIPSIWDEQKSALLP
jgi:hypothetical protein